jgi:hypothetical protein
MAGTLATLSKRGGAQPGSPADTGRTHLLIALGHAAGYKGPYLSAA